MADRRPNELADLVDAQISRRKVLIGGVAAAVGTVFATQTDLLRVGTAHAASAPVALAERAPRTGSSRHGGAPLLGFAPIAASQADDVIVPDGYVVDVIYRWGDPINASWPQFKPDATNTAEEQRRQAGMGHDGMEAFELRSHRHRPRGLLVVNHEFAEDFLLFPDGDATWDPSKTAKSQYAHGVSVIEVELEQGHWRVVPSPYARRITAHTRMKVDGPAAGHPHLRTNEDPSGRKLRGTANNCAVGKTLWNTFLTCEENFNAYFGTTTPNPTITPLMAAYGIGADGFGPNWWRTDPRFDIVAEPNESNRFGWIVEIDPYRPNAKPVKHTALGRFKHENAMVAEAKDGRVVVYTGDDERGQFMYKFVSRYPWRWARFFRRSPLEEGTLYVARFDDGSETGDGAGVGEWLPLVHGRPGLTTADGFTDQGDVLVRARQAAEAVGATRMDRPEWVAVHPHTHDVYLTLTNNSQRGSAYPTDDANPRPNNTWGHIIRWREKHRDHGATRFRWDLFVLGGDPANPAHGATPGIDPFGSPDGLGFDKFGRLWIETDGSQPVPCNNQMLVADPSTAEVRRFLVGPNGCEITGLAFAPDHKTVFVNIQHPGEGGTAANPRLVSNWPDFDPAGRPRSATLAIRRADGGIVGT